MHRAAYGGSVELVAFLLDAVDKKTALSARTGRGETALHIACRKNNRGVVELLLRHGASPLATNTAQNATCLHAAATEGSVSCAQAIFEAQTTTPEVLRRLLDGRDNSMRTPLHVAASNGDYQLCKLMINLGAPLNARDEKMKRPLEAAHAACQGLLAEATEGAHCRHPGPGISVSLTC